MFDAEPIVPVRDLNSVLCSARFPTEPMASVSVLKSDECSATVEVAPTDAVRMTTLPLKIDDVRPSEHDSDLNR